MIVKSVLNEKALKALGIGIIGKRRRIFSIVLSVLFALYIVIAVINGKYGSAAFFVVCEVVLVIEMIIIKRRFIKINLDRLEESTGEREKSIIIEFNDTDSFIIVNPVTNTQMDMKYSCLDSLTEKNGYVFLWTNAKQFFAFSLDQFEDKSHKTQFYELLRKKVTNLKMKVK